MADFIEKRLLDKVSFGSQSGFEFKTDIKQMRNGQESRQAQWDAPLRPLNVIFRLLTPADKQQLEDAFLVCKGRAIGFRFRDPLNYRVAAMPFAIGTGAHQTAQLVRVSTFDASVGYPITKPVQGSVSVFADGVLIPSSIQWSTGIAEFTAPDGAVVTWTGEYDVPVRFDSDSLIWTYDMKEHDRCSGEAGPRVSTDIGLQELRQ